ncbi:hypothetical protein RRG08_065147 [Elysia crispata]|uniref:thiopurine S-methyltransferase n=1 Tax=Elysia crispata TaxID=231223 RepID=A0AAE0Z2Y6_9GAST|nr:hypothetical protein RRG08_065147 [Elysia crispata]
MEVPDLRAGAEYWHYRYTKGFTEWQLEKVYPMLIKHYEKMNPNGKAERVFYPMCGMSLDMNWLVDQGVSVVGVEIAQQALETFISKSNHNWTISHDPELDTATKMFIRNDGKMKLYCADIQEFSPEIEGKFDAIYDRGSLQFVQPGNVSRYSQVLKDLLKPGGRILLEVVEYDPKILEDKTLDLPMKVPPPYTMNSEDIKRLFEPDCSVERVETYKSDRFLGENVDFHVHLIIKI